MTDRKFVRSCSNTSEFRRVADWDGENIRDRQDQTTEGYERSSAPPVCMEALSELASGIYKRSRGFMEQVRKWQETVGKTATLTEQAMRKLVEVKLFEGFH